MQNQSRSPREGGAILLLVAISIVVIVSFVALGIDSYRIHSGRTEKRFSSDYAALAALEAYYNPENYDPSLAFPAVPTITDRYTVAKSRAEAIARQNRISAKAGSPNLGSTETLDTTPANGNSPGSIEMGVWWTSAECGGEGSPSCPCGTPPCLELCTWNQLCSSGRPPNSARVNLRTKDNDPIYNIFAGVFGNYTRGVEAGSTGYGDTPPLATIIPRHVMLLFDLGRGAIVDNTRLVEREGVELLVGARPEPVSTHLDGVYDALDIFRNNSTTQDRIGWIGFDQNMNGSGLRTSGGLQPATASIVTQMMNATNPSSLSGRAGYGLLPNFDTGSNISAALNSARSILAASPTFAFSNNTIVLFTNAIANNCDVPEALHPTASCPLWYVDNIGVKAVQFQAQALASRNLYTTGSANLAPSANGGTEISLQVIMTGDSAHTVLRQSSTGCMTEDQMRVAGPSVIGFLPDYSSQSSRESKFDALGTIGMPHRFFDAGSWLYSLSRSVGGGWRSIMPPCPVAPACSAGGGNVITVPPSGMSGYMDIEGRVFCDPQRLTPRQQLQAFLSQRALNPAIVLVQ